MMNGSTMQTGGQERNKAIIPRAAYRLQLHKEFRFVRAQEIVPYLRDLGISHCYTSPYLQARPGSLHGYDIIDHSNINAEFGSRKEYEEFIAVLGRHGMAHLFDLVPNHMGVGSDNQWWMDVLENGRLSLYADFFDINWQPGQKELQDRILLPVLRNHYGAELEEGRIQLVFRPDRGAFHIQYYEQRFPVAPATYPAIIGLDLARLEAKTGCSHEGLHELHSLIASLKNLARDRDRDTDPEKLRLRQRKREMLKGLLAGLCLEVKEISSFIEENVRLYNGRKHHPGSFDLLHELLDRQAYRLSFWRVASDEINYRRFFDINDLACLRMEEPRVFRQTHGLVLDLISTGKIDALRIDHPDGLYDPGAYFQRLQRAIRGESDSDTVLNSPPSFYIVVEKILADFEHLPGDWAVHGTTGYDFGALVGGLFVEPASEKQMTTLYHRFIGERLDPDDQIRRCKKKILRTTMAGELNVLADRLHKLAKLNRHTQDFTLNSLREALIEIIALLPVYRTYITSDRIEKSEQDYIAWAIAGAKKGPRAENTLIYDFIKSILLQTPYLPGVSLDLESSLHFTMKLQQYTGPVMAKGVEDTFFYIYNRLLSLNEVGADPRRFSVSTAAFHHANIDRHQHWPHAMLNTSTHDSKRSEDVRARISVLSEMPREWRNAVRDWSRINRRHKTRVEGRWSPSKNDEYAFYQTLLGIWPLDEPDQDRRHELIERLAAYMLKAIREAKLHTSWTNRDPAYEEAVESFVRAVLADERKFFRLFLPIHRRTSWFGMLNSLAQLLLKLTSPGVPDIYQGSEVWQFRLVDPDNRARVDFGRRRRLLEEMGNALVGEGPRVLVSGLLGNMADGRVKLYATWRTLTYRRLHPELFEQGSYLPLQVEGRGKDHVCAFMRRHGEKVIVAAVPRLCAGLLGQKEGRLPCGPDVWQDTVVVLPEHSGLYFRDIFTGEGLVARNGREATLSAAEIFAVFPVALLENTNQGGDHE